MSTPQRWYLYDKDDFGYRRDAQSEHDPDGEWCLFEDVEKALATLNDDRERANAVATRLEAEIKRLTTLTDCMRDELEKIENALGNHDGDLCAEIERKDALIRELQDKLREVQHGR